MNSPKIEAFHQWCGNTKRQTLIMGIVNVTPDSFSDGGLFLSRDKAVSHGMQLIQDGADILDIGGESTRPNATPVSLEEELSRVIPVIESLREKTDGLISIDTTKSQVADKALQAGADIVNDISGLTFDQNMMITIAKWNVPIIIMHIKGTPQNMQKNPHYKNVMEEIIQFLSDRVDAAITAGISRDKIILDPGIGFGKTVDDNFKLLNHLGKICDLGFPVLLGPSRKAFIGETLNLPPNQREEGTAAAVTAGILNGARLFRVHDVKAMKRVATISDKITEAA
jgi:dihydropteroate synthase